MKKLLSLFIVLVMVLSMGTIVGAVGDKETLGDLSFNTAYKFVKVSQKKNSIGFENIIYNSHTISLNYMKGYLEGTNAKNIAEVDENILFAVIDDACSAENFSKQMTSRNGFNVNVILSDKYAEMKQTNTGIPMYLYEVNYKGEASGKEPFYGHYTVAVFGYFNDMYMFEFDRPQGETSTNQDFINMLHTVSFGETNSDTIKIKIDGEYITPDSDPVIVNDRTLVPIRAVAEKLGFIVDWDPEERIVLINNEKVLLLFEIDNPYMLEVYFDKQEGKELDVAPTIMNDRTYLPLRAVGEALGCDVDWDASTRTVIINSK